MKNDQHKQQTINIYIEREGVDKAIHVSCTITPFRHFRIQLSKRN